MAKRIIFYRHGERSDTAPQDRKIPHDILYDPPLTELGHRQAQAAAGYLFSQLSGSIRIISSPMLRCVQTVSYLADRLGLPVYLQNAFGEAFDKDWGDVYSRLYVRHERDCFPISCEIREEPTILQPERTEDLEGCGERMKKVLLHCFDGIEEETVVICTHLYVIWGVNIAHGDSFNIEDASFTQICEYARENRELRLVKNGFSEHLRGIN